MLKILQISATIIPYMIALIIVVLGIRKSTNTIIEWDEANKIYKNKHTNSGKFNIMFPLMIFVPIPIADVIYVLTTNSNNGSSIISLAMFFVGKLIIDYALYFSVQPYEYNAGFYIALKPFKIGIGITIIGILLTLIKV